MTLQLRLSKRFTAALFAIALIPALLFASFASTADAQKTPAANKVAVAGSGVLIAAPSVEITLLTTRMKNPGSKALLLGVTLECSILTDLLTQGNDISAAEAKAQVWVEVNGEPVQYAEDVADGRVTFCEREYQRTTSMFDDLDATIDDFIRTKASHGFNWVALHDGAGDKVIEVKADLTRNATDNATAELVIGARTLTVEPVDVANDETLSN